jgi:riboflavin transporter FmnP
MDTKLISLIAVFAALAVVLNPTISRISVPAPFFPLLFYEVWEIPIVVALFLVGPKPAAAVGLIASFALLAFRPTYMAIGGIVACVSMLAGAYTGYWLSLRKVTQEKTPSARKTVVFCTAGAIIFRTLVMAIQNYAMLRYPIIGLNLSEAVIIAIIPPIALFNATEPLYVIPLGYFIARITNKNLKVGNKI